jgi:hypothetical protein
VRELASAGSAAPAVSADRFTAVFLTGATGFVGRFVLADLLRQSDRLTEDRVDDAFSGYTEFTRAHKIRMQ